MEHLIEPGGRNGDLSEILLHTRDRIYERISVHAPRGVWSRADFLDLGPSPTVEKALQRLHETGAIRRPLRGFYDKPIQDAVTNKWIYPSRVAFIEAIARRDQLDILVDGMTAAAELGLTPLVPRRSTIYATTRPRTVRIGVNQGDPAAPKSLFYTLNFKRLSLGTSFWAGRPGMYVAQASTWLPGDAANPGAVSAKLLRYLSNNPQREAILADLQQNSAILPAWLGELVASLEVDRLRASHDV